jgi:transposase
VQAGVLEALQHALLDELGEQGCIDWGRAAVDSFSVRAKKGAPHRSQSDGPRQEGLQASSGGRRPGLAPGPVADSRQPPRQPAGLGAAGQHRAGGGCARQTSAASHKLHADKEYDHRFIRQGLRQRYIRPRLARRGIDSSQQLGKHRWKVERTGTWLHGMRRLAMRYERRTDIHYAFLQLGCCVVLFLALTRWL